MNLLEKLDTAVDFLKQQIGDPPSLAITLGSGLSSFVEKKMNVQKAIPFGEIPHFIPPSVDGHKGQLVFGTVHDVPVVALQGRIHFYEGHSLQEVTFPTRVLARLGVQGLLLTNAAGGIGDQMRPGEFMIIKDHINLTGNNPLIGPNESELGPRFPDMSEVYDRRWTETLQKIFKRLQLRHSTGIYCGVLGPSYETAAEVRYLKTIGGHAVGMSTVSEAIVAKHMGLRLAGISCITNLATGLSDQRVTHEEVKDVASRVENEFSQAVAAFVQEAT